MKKFLIKVKFWFSNVMRGVTHLLSAFFFNRSVGNITRYLLDINYIQVNLQLLEEAILHVSDEMVKDGWKYIAEKEDCDNFAMYKSSAIRHYLRDIVDGNPYISVFCYITDKGYGHAIIKCKTSEGVKYYEPQLFGENSIKPMELSYAEEKRIIYEIV